MHNYQFSILLLGLLICFIGFWFIRKTLQEGSKALKNVNSDNDKSSE